MRLIFRILQLPNLFAENAGGTYAQEQVTLTGAECCQTCSLRMRPAGESLFCDYRDYHHESASAPDAGGRYTVKVDEYIDRIHPDCRGHAMQMIQELQEGKQNEFRETYLIHWFNDREYEWVQVQSCIYNRDADGKPQRIIGSAQCVTDQKEMEMTLQQAKEDLARKNMWVSSVMKIARVLPWGYDFPMQHIMIVDYQ